LHVQGSLDLMMKIFNGEFSEEFMPLAGPLDRRPTNVMQPAKSDVSDFEDVVPVMESTKPFRLQIQMCRSGHF
jgi:hypothetical protein